MIPKALIIETRSRPGVPNAVSLVQVKHVSGGVSVLGFKSYDQNVAAFTGTAKHAIWCDEEPTDLMLYSEMLMRTMSTNGIIYTTTTPIYGMTPFIESFEKTADFLGDSEPCIARDFLESSERPSRALIRGGWDHAPWLTEDAKREILAATPEHLRDAKSKGIPSVGEGNVYQLNWSEVSCASFEIPDYWKKWYALDVGWRYTGAVWFAKDPNTDITYVYDVYKAEKKEPLIHAAAIKLRGDWIAGVIDPASEQGNQKDGTKMIEHYRKQGLKLIDAENAKEAGIYAVWGSLSNGKLKYFSNLRELQAEHMSYRRDKDGKIIKTNDHLMDCVRYGVMSGHKVAKQKPVAKGAGNGYVPRYNL
jgi:phage terminase large subunit-like protein